MVSFYLRDFEVHNGRVTGKFIEKLKIKNPYIN